MALRIAVAPGEVIDKITILEIKSERITDATKLRNINHELDVLSRELSAAVSESDQLNALKADLKSVNEQLWVIEDDIRDCERSKNFGPKFIELARAVYITNDKRAALKRQINELLNSNIFEEKSYAAY